MACDEELDARIDDAVQPWGATKKGDALLSWLERGRDHAASLPPK